MTNKNINTVSGKPAQGNNAAVVLQAKLNQQAATEDEPKSLVADDKFQEYKSSRPSIRLITKTGIRITFTNFKLLTQTKEVIEYLNDEIEKGLPGITKGKLLTLDEVNPMQTLRREIEAEVRADLIKEAADKAAGISRDMGTSAQQGLKATSTNQLAT